MFGTRRLFLCLYEFFRGWWINIIRRKRENHVEKNATIIESYVPGFEPSKLKTKYFLNIIVCVLINYEILEDDSILEECPSINNYIYSVIRDRVLPENPLTTLKRAGVDEK